MLACLTDWSPDQFDLISLIGLHLRQIGQCNVMQWTMLCYDLIWECMYNDRCKFEVLQLPLFNQLGTRMDDSNGCQTFRVNRDWILKNRRICTMQGSNNGNVHWDLILITGYFCFFVLFSKDTATSRHRNDDEWEKKSQLDANGQLGKTRRLPGPTER